MAATASSSVGFGAAASGASNSSTAASNLSTADVLRIMVATDTHLGYGERDPIRQDDSYDAFNELFELANQHECDMVLLAGDLFHDNKPSRRAMQKAMEIMRDHCLGDKPVQIEVVSDQKANFHTKYETVNFEDPNYNVQLPVFSIHGNHDDPAGDGGLAALDLLSTANLINYFGRVENFERISLSPVLITKGQTKLALYGLGHVRDERLARCFERKEVRVARPVQERDNWFSILALHQNRMPRGAGAIAKGFIKDQQLPGCIDLVIWGHEHECLIGGGMSALSESAGNDFVVLQPGSSVATALVEGEARKKHVGLLSICGDQWQMTPLPLTSVRPFIIREVALRDHEDDYDLHNDEGLTAFLAEQVEAMIVEVGNQSPMPQPPPERAAAAPARRPPAGATASSPQKKAPKLPLVRLKVDYGGFSTCNPQKFGQRFVGRVANPADILLFQRTKVRRREEKAAAEAAKLRGGSAHGRTAGIANDDDDEAPEDAATQIQDIMAEFLRSGKDSLRLLPQSDLNAAVFHDFVGRDNKNAIRNSVEAALKRTQACLVREQQHRDAVDQAGSDRVHKQAAVEALLQKLADERESRGSAQASMTKAARASVQVGEVDDASVASGVSSSARIGTAGTGAALGGSFVVANSHGEELDDCSRVPSLPFDAELPPVVDRYSAQLPPQDRAKSPLLEVLRRGDLDMQLPPHNLPPPHLPPPSPPPPSQPPPPELFHYQPPQLKQNHEHRREQHQQLPPPQPHNFFFGSGQQPRSPTRSPAFTQVEAGLAPLPDAYAPARFEQQQLPSAPTAPGGQEPMRRVRTYYESEAHPHSTTKARPSCKGIAASSSGGQRMPGLRMSGDVHVNAQDGIHASLDTGVSQVADQEPVVRKRKMLPSPLDAASNQAVRVYQDDDFDADDSSPQAGSQFDARAPRGAPPASSSAARPITSVDRNSGSSALSFGGKRRMR